jgi:hypothetical protein
MSRSAVLITAARQALCLWPALLLSACAVMAPPLAQPGQSEAQMLATMGTPTGRYPMAGGAQRVEYATGPFGRFTWMVDLDAAGRVSAVQQVLTRQNFAQVRHNMSRDEVLRLLGRPADKAGEYMNRQTWSWRFETYECEWVRITFTAEGWVRGGASYLPDPRCDADH